MNNMPNNLAMSFPSDHAPHVFLAVPNQSQPELHLPPVPTNEILRERIRRTEQLVLAAMRREDYVEFCRLFTERVRMQAILNTGTTRRSQESNA